MEHEEDDKNNCNESTCNMKDTIKIIALRAFGLVHKYLQNDWILRRVLRTWIGWLSLRHVWNTRYKTENITRKCFHEKVRRRKIILIKIIRPHIPGMTLIDYMLRKEGGRRLSTIEDSVDASLQQLEGYIHTTQVWSARK